MLQTILLFLAAISLSIVSSVRDDDFSSDLSESLLSVDPDVSPIPMNTWKTFNLDDLMIVKVDGNLESNGPGKLVFNQATGGLTCGQTYGMFDFQLDFPGRHTPRSQRIPHAAGNRDAHGDKGADKQFIIQ
jgi:hypothetical protein